jgi:aspartate kinase
MAMKVCKFGGTSLADASAVTRVCDIVLADAGRRIVVVSAPGKRAGSDTKVTDLLIAAAEEALAGRDGSENLRAVAGRYRDIQAGLGLRDDVAAEVERDLRARAARTDLGRAAFLDLMKAAGEDHSARLVAAALRARGRAAAYVEPGAAGMRLTAEFGNARLLPESYDRLAALAGRPEILVFPGFFGVTPDGRVVTFPRGGSDITGAILAAAVRAEAYENFTDVDSVFAADPRVVPGVRPIAELTFREMRELAYAGFSVLHDEAIAPAVHAGIPIYVKNTQRPELPGTKIVPRHADPNARRVVGIAGSDGFCTIFVDKYLMNREIGFGRRLLQILEEEGISYEHTPSGIDSLSVILRESALTGGREAHVLARIRAELQVDDVEVERGLALIMIVGEGMRFHTGLAARATGALADAGINLEMMNQGSSEISIMFGVKAADRVRAVKALYGAFFEGGVAA